MASKTTYSDGTMMLYGGCDSIHYIPLQKTSIVEDTTPIRQLETCFCFRPCGTLFHHVYLESKQVGRRSGLQGGEHQKD